MWVEKMLYRLSEKTSQWMGRACSLIKIPFSLLIKEIKKSGRKRKEGN